MGGGVTICADGAELMLGSCSCGWLGGAEGWICALDNAHATTDIKTKRKTDAKIEDGFICTAALPAG